MQFSGTVLPKYDRIKVMIIKRTVMHAFLHLLRDHLLSHIRQAFFPEFPGVAEKHENQYIEC